MSWYKVAKEEQLGLFDKEPIKEVKTEKSNISYLGFADYGGSVAIDFMIGDEGWRYFIDRAALSEVKKDLPYRAGKARDTAQKAATLEVLIDKNRNVVLGPDGNPLKMKDLLQEKRDKQEQGKSQGKLNII